MLRSAFTSKGAKLLYFRSTGQILNSFSTAHHTVCVNISGAYLSIQEGGMTKCLKTKVRTLVQEVRS
jgi:hypothetical protein